MKQIEIITSESVLIIGIKNDNWNPRPTIDTEFSIIPIIINDTDKDITGRIWEVKDPFIAREKLGLLTLNNHKIECLSLNRDMNSGIYTFCHYTNEVAYLDKVKNIIYNNTEYVHLRFTYDEKTFKSIMTKTMTIDAIHNLINSVKDAGCTVTYIDWDTGKPRVAGRFKTKEEVDKFLEAITADGSGWMDEEISTISVHNDYNYMLPY